MKKLYVEEMEKRKQIKILKENILKLEEIAFGSKMT